MPTTRTRHALHTLGEICEILHFTAYPLAAFVVLYMGTVDGYHR